MDTDVSSTFSSSSVTTIPVSTAGSSETTPSASYVSSTTVVPASTAGSSETTPSASYVSSTAPETTSPEHKILGTSGKTRQLATDEFEQSVKGKTSPLKKRKVEQIYNQEEAALQVMQPVNKKIIRLTEELKEARAALTHAEQEILQKDRTIRQLSTEIGVVRQDYHHALERIQDLEAKERSQRYGHYQSSDQDSSDSD